MICRSQGFVMGHLQQGWKGECVGFGLVSLSVKGHYTTFMIHSFSFTFVALRDREFVSVVNQSL